MLTFVNAKINLGLNIIGKREDGYHLLETMFYPAGRYSGLPQSPDPFCDLLEVTVDNTLSETNPGINYIFSGNRIDCPPERNLVVKAAGRYLERQPHLIERCGRLTVRLRKSIPDGAGMGGGSADATFTLKALNEVAGNVGLQQLDDEELEKIAVTLGADCPVFVKNEPVYAEGIGEIFTPAESIWSRDPLKGRWLAVVKPDLHISTSEAFAGVSPHKPGKSIPEILAQPIETWRKELRNDFEDSLFPKYPELQQLKEGLYAEGALYASMTGSGAALYGIFNSREKSLRSVRNLQADYSSVMML